MARDLPLAGVTVIDLGQVYNGPYATFLMAMAGAEVIKIEPPGGENLRRRSVVGGAALPFAMLNSNKKFVTLNLKDEQGKELLRRLVEGADVLLENFAPGVMDRLGVGYDALQRINPRLIYAAGTGYGSWGGYKDLPAMDLTIQAMSGIMSITGYEDLPPVKCGPAICDFSGGTHLYGAVMTALFERERTGVGRKVEVAMIEAVYATLSSSLGLWYGSKGDAPARTGNRHGGMAESPYNVYAASDGFIAVLCVGETHWQSLLQALNRADLKDDPRFSTLKERVNRMDEVDALVQGFTETKSRGELAAIFRQYRVPFAPVRDLTEVTSDPELHSSGFLNRLQHPEYGEVVVSRSPMRYEDAPTQELVPSGRLGCDNDRVLSERLGLDQETIDLHRSNGVI
ncbi:formyl-CoA transferase [Caballeronia temeraria]|uniref:Formyl-CoA transferase n=1 Tax=Caballeronia temeraria TaxID=1777137 RepID=A0A158DL95_9BURK|nr:CoA transferase [Caballeronia temeraria]SAK94557.1 formyl-CoA transferase [Caballeronia temeraria]